MKLYRTNDTVNDTANDTVNSKEQEVLDIINQYPEIGRAHV